MPKLIISIDGTVVRELQLNRDRTAVGRRPYNDIVLDHRTVSGEHAIFRFVNGEMVLEDLVSTNGTFVNGVRIREQVLARDDMLSIGKYQIRYQSDENMETQTETSLQRASPLSVSGVETVTAPSVRVMNGPSQGRVLTLTRPVMTLGKRGASVVSITRKTHGFELAHVEGDTVPTVNGVSLEEGPIVLHNRDRIMIGATRLEYLDP